jgi:hypothetical protein
MRKKIISMYSILFIAAMVIIIYMEKTYRNFMGSEPLGLDDEFLIIASSVFIVINIIILLIVNLNFKQKLFPLSNIILNLSLMSPLVYIVTYTISLPFHSNFMNILQPLIILGLFSLYSFTLFLLFLYLFIRNYLINS